MNVVAVLLVPLLVMFFALGMERLEAQLCGAAQRDDELDELADNLAEQATRIIPALIPVQPPPPERT